MSVRNILVLVLTAFLCGLFWLFGADVVFRGDRPFSPWWVRAAVIVGVFAVVALALLLIDRWRRRQVLRRMTGASGAAATVVEPSMADETELCITEAIRWSEARAARPGRLGPGAYALPWVVVAGRSDSGRSTLVSAALLDGAGPVREAGGARFTLSEEAVVIEVLSDLVAGAGSDRDPWTRLFRQLAKARPRRPIDAVVLAVPVGDMLSDGPAPAGAGMGGGAGVGGAAIPGASAAVVSRARLQQAMRVLGAAPPVYIAVTQSDRLLGFAAGLDGTEDGAALGASVPAGADAATGVRDGFQDLASTLGRRLPHRLAIERDAGRRSQAGELPAQLAQLGQGCGTFVQEMMRAGAGDQRIDLRGVYLTAAGGDQAMGVDAWSRSFADHFALRPPPVVPAVSPPSFVPGLFRGLVLADAGSGGNNRGLEQRTRRKNALGYGLCLAVLVLFVLLFETAYVADAKRLELLAQRANQLSGFAQAEGETPYAFDKVLPMLNVAQQASDADGMVWFAGGSVGLPLLPPDGADGAAEAAYGRALVNRLLPALREALVRQMNDTQDLTRLRELLTLYLQTGSPSRWNPAAFTAWAQTSLQGLLPFNALLQQEAMDHVRHLVPLMPVVSGMNDGAVQSARERLRRVPHPEQIYARLKAIAASSGEAPPIDVASNLGAAGAQLLMLRPQAGLPSIVPGLYTKTGFYNVFLRRLPGLAHSEADDAFIMGPSPDDRTSKMETQGVVDLYVRDYIQQWRGVTEQVALQALPDLGSLVGGLQALSSPDSPILALVELVRTNTDLSVPTGPDASGLLSRIAGPAVAGAVGGTVNAAANAVVGSAAGAALPAGLTEWPGTNIRLAFLPIIGLGAGPGQAPSMRLQGSLVAAYGFVSGIATAQNPAAAALQAAASAISGQGPDTLSALRTQAVGLPRPIDGIFRDLYNNIWNVLLQMTLERIVTTWSSDVAPACAQAIARRYPFADADTMADRDVLPKDFGSFFGPSGVIDKWLQTYLMPFVQAGSDGQLTLLARGNLRLELSREGLAQINRARTFRDLFFDAAGNLAVRMTLTPRYLDPRAFSVTLKVDQSQATYRHEPPRAMELRWSGSDEGAASVRMSLTDGSNPELSATGPWALFRLLDQAERQDGADGLTIAYTMNEARAAYQIRAASVMNPIVNKDWRSFRCVPRL